MIHSTLMMSDARINNGISFVAEVECADKWPSQAHVLKALRVAIEILNAGFRGVEITHHKCSDGSYVINPMVDLESPEGLMVRTIFASAKAGNASPHADALVFLQSIYKKQGLELPTPLEGQR